MKKYPITFTSNYPAFSNDENSEDVVVYKKWKGKKMTILELEKHIGELDRVVFDGETIEVYNDFRQ